MNNDLKPISKLLSLVLRHKPEVIGITLDANGWVNVHELIDRINARNGFRLTLEKLEKVVETNDKQRFAFNDDHTAIRANQGHSVEVDVQLAETTPPEVLYHGTVDKFLESIRATGLDKRSRQHVHLSRDRATAVTVGGRRGKPVILEIDAARMHEAGHAFYRSANGVWLCDAVPVEYISFPEA